ncbi:MAG: translational GTPase TypA, partial [Chloroflexi bacterium]|nr:translational GTPase TypA [Chloroflexota bacterium]
DPEGGFQMLVAARTYDAHLGHIGIGRIGRGRVHTNDSVVRISRDGEVQPYKVAKVYVFEGLGRKEVDEAEAGEIVAINLSGAEDIAISDTLASASQPEALPAIDIGEPTVQMTFGVNTSPFAGQDGKFVTSRQLRARLYSELKTNVGLRVADTDSPDVLLVSGRGELHLAILVETMRREGYEFQVSKPQAIVKLVDDVKVEPYEKLTLDIDDTVIGALTEELSSRLAQMQDMHNNGQGEVRIEFKIPTRGLIGFRSFFLKATRGNGVINTEFIGYEPHQGMLESTRNGVLVAAETGTAVIYGLNNAQQRGSTFVDASTPVYEGMVVGSYTREDDIVVNVCKMKQLTNVRSSSSDMSIKLTPPVRMSLEECLDFIAEDEVVEVTPKNIRLRKRILNNDERHRLDRDKHKVRVTSQ